MRHVILLGGGRPERLENAATPHDQCATRQMWWNNNAVISRAGGLPHPRIEPDSPLSSRHAIGTDSEVIIIHHKPGHHGGPPWARRDDGWRDRDRYDHYDRRRVTECRTRYEERYDPYRGIYVRRPVEVCSR